MKILYRMIFIIIALVVLVPLALLLLATSLDYRPPDKEAAPEGGNGPSSGYPGDTISLVSWNLGYFGLGAEHDFFYDGGTMTRPAEESYRRDAGLALEYLRDSEKADFYFFQEIDLDSRRSYRDNQVDLAAIELPGYSYSWALNYKVTFVPVPINDPLGRVKSALATFGRYPMEGHTRYAFPGGYSWPVRLFMLDRCFLLSRVRLASGRELVLINTHNEAFDDGSHRIAQLGLLRQVMLAEYRKGNYVLAGGDWNMNPVGFDTATVITADPVRRIQPEIDPAFLPEGWTWAFDPSAPTNRDVAHAYSSGRTLVTIIDFFVVSPNLEVLDVAASDLRFLNSDHNPVRILVRPLK